MKAYLLQTNTEDDYFSSVKNEYLIVSVVLNGSKNMKEMLIFTNQCLLSYSQGA